jgi:FAD synthetase
VLLHLLVATRSRRYRRTDRKEERCPNGANGYAHAHGSQPAALSPLKSIYITCSSPFDAVEEFVLDTKGAYNLDLFRTSPGGIPMKEALSIYQRAEPDVKAILVGTRRDDPHGSVCSLWRFE